LLDRKILYVEDNFVTGELVRAIVEHLGYEAIVAPTVFDAKEMINAPLLFLMYLLDVRLPDGSGIDLCRTIRESDATTPIVIYSANAGYRGEALAAGAQEFVPKSGDTRLLETTIRRLISLPQTHNA
jgi:DNA-binding response OmpR family regulator